MAECTNFIIIKETQNLDKKRGTIKYFCIQMGKKHIVFIYVCVASYTQYIKTAHLENKN